jgi:hypothetical protein
LEKKTRYDLREGGRAREKKVEGGKGEDEQSLTKQAKPESRIATLGLCVFALETAIIF